MNDRERRRRRKRNQSFKVFTLSLFCIFAIICFFSLIFLVKIKYKDSAIAAKKDFTENMKIQDLGTESESGNDIIQTEETLSEVLNVEKEYERILSLSPGVCAFQGSLPGETAGRLFYEGDITQELPRIQGISYQENPHVALTDLAYLRMLYYGLDGNTYVGEMIVNQKIKEDVLHIFRELYENRYPIERMVLVDEYAGEDEASMEANNTSAFNYRTIAGSDKLSNHSYGMAVDLNPKYNPYVKQVNGSSICQPESSGAYADRTKEFDYKIDEYDLAYQLFTQAGFTWGGSWNSVKDYQHFEKE